ncbi:hypothetical protein Amsp01_097450 [Amycolatopsis sp. NBRC 101858]|uniref:caspase, EACC1-associated type n=1 Tax=Amycolatopsis sp. NBRC 101858 TaxID=3032200 RepID=UPI0024A0451C|nr:caspase family protein [Amycolatopsis sp. NBRC 101858]GLY43722.1 hypothetical protein Amsp01_097450 [Amycolatopsis sp. NBRC 101858]
MAGRRRALIVANGEYDNAGLQRLGSPAADADALVEVLSDRAISDFEVRVVRNETAHVVQAEIEDLCAEGRPDDVLLMHFSCHGLKDDSGGLYFAARNTRPDRLRSSAVPAQFVQQCLRQSRSRSVVLLLDCCYGGAFGQGVAVRASGDANVLDSFRGGRGRAVITASNSIEYAFEGATLASDEPAQPSVFTAALVEGLRTGEADRDEDGWIALGELYEYLFDRVRERNPKQTPSRDIEMQGELYLAKSRRRRIKPSPIPADLAGAITAENPFTRLGAVAELRRRLASDNLPVAMGAFEALKSMAATDIQHVAAAASDALGFAVVRVDVPSVRLSAVSGARASASLRVAGPPVAREVRFEASHAWISVTQTASGADLSVTAGEPGVRRGRVVVTGPTGDAVVEVEIEAVPEPEPGPAGEPVAAAAPVAGESAGGPGPVPEPVAEEGNLPEPAATGPAPKGLASAPVVSEPAPAIEGAVAAQPASKSAGVPGPRPAAAGGPPPEAAVSAEPAPEPVDAERATAAEAEGGPAAELGVLAGGAGDGPAAELGVAAGPAGEAGDGPAAELAVAAGEAGDPPAAADLAAAEVQDRPAAREPAPSVADPVAGTAGLLGIAAAVFAVAGLALDYYYSESLAVYRPGMHLYVVVVAVCAVVAGVLTLVSRTRRTGAALLFGVGFAGLFGLLRFAAEGVVVSAATSDVVLGAGFTFELIAHAALVVAGLFGLVAVRRTAGGLGAGMVRGREAWVAVGLGMLVAAGWLAQLSELAGYDPSESGRVSAYFTLGAVLAVALPVVAAILRPAAVGCAVLAAGTAGLAGVLGPTFGALGDYSSLTFAGLLTAVTGLVLLLVDAVVWGVRLRNQPIERQS